MTGIFSAPKPQMVQVPQQAPMPNNAAASNAVNAASQVPLQAMDQSATIYAGRNQLADPTVQKKLLLGTS